MKKFYGAMMAIAVAAMSFVSCNITPEPEPLEEEVTYHTVTFTALADVDSKAQVIEGDDYASYVWHEWDLDYFHVFENDVEATNLSVSITPESENKSVTITATFADSDKSSFTYTAYVASDVSNGVATIMLEQAVPNYINNFRPDADLLVAQPITVDEPLSNLEFRFKRVVSVNKMTVKGLPVGSIVLSVDIKTDSEHPLPTQYDFINESYSGEAYEISVNPNMKEVDENGSLPIYFVAPPVSGAQITVKVKAEVPDYGEAYYQRTFNTPVTFACGTMFRFGANIEGFQTDDSGKPMQYLRFSDPGPFTFYTQDSEYFEMPELLGAVTDVTFSSEDESIARIDPDDNNKIYFGGEEGTTRIYASTDETNEYACSQTYFELTVVDASAFEFGDEEGFIGYEFDFYELLEGWPMNSNPDGMLFTCPLGSFDAYADARESNPIKLYLSPSVYQTEVSDKYGLHIPEGGYIGLPAIPGYSLNYVDIQVHGDECVPFRLSSTAPEITHIVSLDFLEYYTWSSYPGSYYYFEENVCKAGESVYMFFDEACEVAILWAEYVPVYEDGAPDISGEHVHNDNDGWSQN